MIVAVTAILLDTTLAPARLGRLVEEHGFDGLFLPEHTHLPVDETARMPTGHVPPAELARYLDPLECLAAVASVTERLLLGTSVLVVPLHDPIVLAKRLATLDLLSGGRVVVGVGAGWHDVELVNHGGDPKHRWLALREKVEAMRALWTEEVASYEGTTVRFGPLRQWPKPVQRPHPRLLIGGSGPNVERRVLTYGDGWFPSARHVDGDELARRMTALRARAAAIGRPAPTVVLQEARATPEAIEDYARTGLDGCTFRVHPTDERSVVTQLRTLQSLAGPLREG